MAEEKDGNAFLQLFADLPGYKMMPWESIEAEEACDLFLTFFFVVYSPQIKYDVYNLFANPRPRESEEILLPYQFYFKGESAINLQLQTKLNSPKIFPFKNLDISVSFLEAMKSNNPTLAFPQIDDIPSFFTERTKFLEIFEQIGRNCIDRVELFCRLLCKILHKHQVFIKSALTSMNLMFIRVLVLRKKDKNCPSFANTFWRIGVEIYNPATRKMFFWSLVNIKLEYAEALFNTSPDIEHIKVGSFEKNIDIDGFIGIEENDSRSSVSTILFERTVDEFARATIPVHSFVGLQQDLFSLFDVDSMDDVVLSTQKANHYDTLGTNRKTQFLYFRHWLIKEYWNWCSTHTSGKRLSPDKLSDLEEKIEEIRADGGSKFFQDHLSDLWFREYEHANVDEYLDGVKVTPRKPAESLSFLDSVYVYYEEWTSWFSEAFEDFTQSEIYITLEKRYQQFMQDYFPHRVIE